jgi:8-oxo-dGTP diphosphatase
MSLIEVGAAVILKKDKVLLTQRNLNKHMGGKWEFPGGKIENDETNEEGLAREIKEELGVLIKIEEKLCMTTHRYPEYLVRLHTYISTLVSTEFVISEHEGIAWVTKDEILSYDLVPADIKIAKKLIKYLNQRNR